jgi:hypothetical protein
MASIEFLYLENNPFYSYTTTLNRVAYNVSFRFSTRGQCWFMDIKSNNNTPIVSSVKLVANYPMIENYALPELTGYFLLIPNLEGNEDKLYTNPEKIADFFQLAYVY